MERLARRKRLPPASLRAAAGTLHHGEVVPVVALKQCSRSKQLSENEARSIGPPNRDAYVKAFE